MHLAELLAGGLRLHGAGFFRRCAPIRLSGARRGAEQHREHRRDAE